MYYACASRFYDGYGLSDWNEIGFIAFSKSNSVVLGGERRKLGLWFSCCCGDLNQ